jgi:hypothetical protein
MMMRRVQTAAGVSGGGGGGEGASESDLLDDSDASHVIFVSCNTSAILATRLNVLVGSVVQSPTKPAFLAADTVRVNFVFTPP